MFFSIIIPVYNVENYLSRCVDSVLKQDFADYEIILIDDGSSDLSGSICDSYLSKSSKVVVIHQPNSGLSKTRNVGIEVASGDFVVFLDSDDWLVDGCLEKLFDQISNNDSADIFLGRAKKINDKGETEDKISYRIKTGLYDIDEYLKEIERPNRYSACAPFSIYNRFFLMTNGLRFREGIIHEDELWTPAVLLAAKKIFVSDVYFYYHYHREGSISWSKDWNKHGLCYFEVAEQLANLFKPLKKGTAKRLREQMVNLYLMAFCYVDDNSKMAFEAKFLYANSYSFKTRLKVLLFGLSPWLFVKIHKVVRKRK